MVIEIPERGGTRTVRADEVATVVQVSPPTSHGWNGHVTLVTGERIATVDVRRVLRQVATIKRGRRAPRGATL